MFQTHAWWRQQMETFSALLALCAGNSPFTGEFPVQRPMKRSFDISFDPRLNKQLSKQPWGGDFRRHGAHCDVTVMVFLNANTMIYIRWYISLRHVDLYEVRTKDFVCVVNQIVLKFDVHRWFIVYSGMPSIVHTWYIPRVIRMCIIFHVGKQ